MIEVEWWDYDGIDEMAEAVAGDVGFIIESALEARSASLVALPGDVEEELFDALVDAKVGWKRVTIVPTDDYLVSVEDERSKARALAKAFLPLGARVFPVVSEKVSDALAAGNAANARLQDLAFPLDLVWLTVGDDGSVAGLVYGDGLEEAINAPKGRHAAGIDDDEGGRVTLTRSAILAARTLLFTVVGTDMKALLEKAIADGHSSRHPVGRLLAEAEQPIDIHFCP